MNAIWLERMSDYQHSDVAITSASHIINHKVSREHALLRHFRKTAIPSMASPADIASTTALLLFEARSAKSFWNIFKELLPAHTKFPGRTPDGADPVNKLLDIGFHHITNIVKKYLTERDVSCALGLIHRARSSTSAPLAYDLVELFRADTVDSEVLRFFRLKKKPLASVDDEIAHFLYELNQRLEARHYISTFKQCHTYEYYIELQILHFIRAVNHNEVFVPLMLPDRHDSRCLTHAEEVVV